MLANSENSSVASDWKGSFLIAFPKKDIAKECSNYHTIALISHSSKIMLKILQARLAQYMTWELPGVQAQFRKVRGTRDQIAKIHWIIKKAREFQKNINFCFIDFTKAFDCVDNSKLWKILLFFFFFGVEKFSSPSCSWCKLWKFLKEIGITDQCQGYTLSPCLFNLYAEYIMRCAGLNHILIRGWITNWNQGCQDKYQQPQIGR